jgi:hypothetical protein
MQLNHRLLWRKVHIRSRIYLESKTGLSSKLFDFDRSAGHQMLATRTLQQSAIEFVLICNFDNARNELQAARGNVVTFLLASASDRIRS